MGYGSDLRYAFRTLARAPGFAGLIVVMLAIGIGATIAIASVVERVVLRPLDFPEAGRLMRICELHESVQGFCIASPPNARDWSRATRTFAEIGLAREWSFILRGDDGAREIPGALASPEFFRAFGIEARVGRLLAPSDLEAGGAAVAVLANGFWQTRFAGDPGVVGRQLILDGEPHEIVGVLPPGVEIPELESAQIWLPLTLFEEHYRRWRGFQAVGRLRPGADLDEARSEMAVLAGRLAEQYPATNDGWGITVVPLHEWIVGPIRPTLLVFLSAVTLVLLIACANAANLLLARGLARRKELAIRAAVGASRGRLILLLLGESLLLALAAGAAGVLLARALLQLFLAAAPRGIPRLDEVVFDGVALAVAVGVSIVTSLLCGLVPALRASKAELGRVLRGADAPEHGGRLAFGLREGLVVAEVALALVLLVGAGLLTRSFVAAWSWQGGFDPQRLLVVSVLCPRDGYRGAEELGAFYRRAVRELAALPAAASAGAASAGPFFGGREAMEFVAGDRPDAAPRTARFFDVDADYFRTVGLPVLRGRPFTARDDAGAARVAIVNATLASRWWPGEDPIGKRIRDAEGRDVAREVVGVVADVEPFWPQRQVDPEIYWPTQQQPRWATFFLVRSDADVAGFAETVDRRLRELDPDLSVGRVVTADELLRRRLVRPRFNMLLVGAFALFALLLALGGTYGVISYAISRRTREIGLRMALGAGRRRILRWVIFEGLKLTVIGVAVGLLGALAVTRWLGSLLYEVRATDGATFAATIAVLAAVALAAVYVPARRAARVEPMVALRCE